MAAVPPGHSDQPASAMADDRRHMPDTPRLAGGATPPSIPDYILLSRIGRGSYGEVWLARNVFGEHRAVKIVYRRDFTDDRPFSREFEGIKRFEPVSRSHPSQLAILHAGRNDQAACFYYVMELADGVGTAEESRWECEKELRSSAPFSPADYVPRTLRSDLEQHGRLPIAQCIEIGLSLTTALAHLHKHGLVHRDIKPSNIIFVNGIPKLADIGLVTDVGDARSIVGTEGYLAPEGPGSPQADIYGLGKVLYEIGMGRDRRHFPDLPLDWQDNPDRARLLELNEILLKACAQDARQRYHSAEEMQADLALLQSGQSIQRLRTVEKRLHLAKRAGSVVAALLLVATGGFVYQQSQTRRVEREKKIAERERRAAEQLLYAADTSLAQQALEAGNLVRATALLDAYRPKPGHDDLRGFEWYYLKDLCRGDEAHTFRGHEQAVQGVAISPDGKMVASCSDDASIKLWDLTTKSNLATLRGHVGAVNAIAFSPDGGALASGGADKTVKVWDLASRAVMVELTNHTEAVTAVAFSPNGKWLVAGTDGSSAKLWDISSGEEIHEFSPAGRIADRVAFSPDGKWLATTGAGPGSFGITLWDLSTMQSTLDLYEGAGQTWGLAFSPDSSVLAATRSDGVVLWDVARRRVLGKLKGHEREVQPVVFSPDGKLVASGSGDTTIRLWDFASRQPIRIFKGHRDWVNSLAFSTNGQVLVSGSADHTVKLWDVSGKVGPGALRGHTDSVRCVAFSPKDRILASASLDGTMKLWDVASGTNLATLAAHTAAVTGVTFSLDGATLYSCSLDTTIRLWDVATGACVATLSAGKRLACLALSPDGRTLASGSGWWDESGSPSEVVFWDLESRQRLKNKVGVLGMVTKLSFSPDGRTLAIGIVDSLELLDVASRRSIFISTNLNEVMAWSPQGNSLFAADKADRDHVAVLDLASLRISGRLQIPGGAGRFMAFSPDGKTLAVFYATARIKLCNVASGREVATLLGHENFGMHLAFSHDGQTLASAGTDGTIRLWRAPRE